MTETRRLLRRLDRSAGLAADASIRAYQRWLSPLKGAGRACAHRIANGGPSCSQHARDLINRSDSLTAALPAIIDRFAACQDAAARLSPTSGATPTFRGPRVRRGQCCIVIPLPACSTTRSVRM